MHFIHDCDYFCSDSSVRAAIVGGDCYIEVLGGTFYLFHGWAVSLKAWRVGACLDHEIYFHTDYLYINHNHILLELLLCL